MDEEIIETENHLCFINLVGVEEDNKYRYEFIFTDDIDNVWGENFDEKPAGLINNLMVDEQYKTETHVVRTTIKFDLVQQCCCFGMQDCMDGIVALAYENIDDYDAYPDDGRLVFNFGEPFNDVSRKLALKNIIML
jgi:hypothetical protein|nr:MAG TPA: hypothetical protein [Bacteriophage sp.]DAO70007.1 MAG TPA: hypothetical protein [Bacteriophage sp.]